MNLFCTGAALAEADASSIAMNSEQPMDTIFISFTLTDEQFTTKK
jgi:hypothetical protein